MKHLSGSPLSWLIDHEQRITKLEASKETMGGKVNWSPRDYVVAAGGLIFLLLATIGKISWLEAAGHMIGGK